MNWFCFLELFSFGTRFSKKKQKKKKIDLKDILVIGKSNMSVSIVFIYITFKIINIKNKGLWWQILLQTQHSDMNPRKKKKKKNIGQ